MAPLDPTSALQRLRWLAAEIRDRPRSVITGGRGADAMAETFGDLDAWLSAGGLWPDAWAPPVVNEGDGRLADQARARYRLELAIDRAFRDDERTDRTLLPAVLGEHAEPKFREHVIRLAAQAVLDEIDAERRQIEAMVTRMVIEQTMTMRSQLDSDGPLPGFRQT